MTINFLLYYIFSTITLVSALMVIQLSNAIYSVLFLILTFCNTACLLLLLGAEFFSFLLLIVYVGAIAVLFLFIVMMLNIKIEQKQISYILPLGILLTFIFINIFNLSFTDFDLLNTLDINLYWLSWQIESLNITNIKVIGTVLYTNFSLLFLLSSLILLVSMIGAIVLTMHQRIDLKKQNLELQLIRNPKGTIKFINLRN